MTTDEIKQSVSMREVVERYGYHPNRAGFISCPFHHGDHTPSMKIYKRDYHCHACGANGDIFSFVMSMEHCDFKTAFKMLGGSYKAKSDHQRNLHHYHLEKRKQNELKRLQKKENEKKQVNAEIKKYREISQKSEVFSDEWTNAMNKLEYLFYKFDYLMEQD